MHFVHKLIFLLLYNVIFMKLVVQAAYCFSPSISGYSELQTEKTDGFGAVLEFSQVLLLLIISSMLQSVVLYKKLRSNFCQLEIWKPDTDP